VTNHLKRDYKGFDRPEVLRFLFHPRPEGFGTPLGHNARRLSIEVEAGISLGACFYPSHKKAPTILFFHGNGEIVADYDGLGGVYMQLGVNFLPVDYRGYGRSGGTPSISAMMADCHAVFDFSRKWLEGEGFMGPMVVMGRSLGSAPALELASGRQSEISGLIMESGFAYEKPLLALLGVPDIVLDYPEMAGLGNLEKIKVFRKPTLVIHAEYDHIIPFSDGQALFQACPAAQKTFLKIPGADHNSILSLSLSEYMAAVKKLCDHAGDTEMQFMDGH